MTVCVWMCISAGICFIYEFIILFDYWQYNNIVFWDIYEMILIISELKKIHDVTGTSSDIFAHIVCFLPCHYYFSFFTLHRTLDVMYFHGGNWKIKWHFIISNVLIVTFASNIFNHSKFIKYFLQIPIIRNAWRKARIRSEDSFTNELE